MDRDAINFETDNVRVVFKKMLVPTFWGMLFMSAVTAIDGIFIGPTLTKKEGCKLLLLYSYAFGKDFPGTTFFRKRDSAFFFSLVKFCLKRIGF